MIHEEVRIQDTLSLQLEWALDHVLYNPDLALDQDQVQGFESEHKRFQLGLKCKM